MTDLMLSLHIYACGVCIVLHTLLCSCKHNCVTSVCLYMCGRKVSLVRDYVSLICARMKPLALS